MYEQASQVANDAVSNIRTVASFCAEKRMMETYETKCKAPKKSGMIQGIISGAGFGFSFFVLYCTYALCFYVGARFMEQGKATFSEVFRVSVETMRSVFSRFGCFFMFVRGWELGK